MLKANKLTSLLFSIFNGQRAADPDSIVLCRCICIGKGLCHQPAGMRFFLSSSFLSFPLPASFLCQSRHSPWWHVDTDVAYSWSCSYLQWTCYVWAQCYMRHQVCCDAGGSLQLNEQALLSICFWGLCYGHLMSVYVTPDASFAQYVQAIHEGPIHQVCKSIWAWHGCVLVWLCWWVARRREQPNSCGQLPICRRHCPAATLAHPRWYHDLIVIKSEWTPLGIDCMLAETVQCQCSYIRRAPFCVQLGTLEMLSAVAIMVQAKHTPSAIMPPLPKYTLALSLWSA